MSRKTSGGKIIVQGIEQGGVFPVTREESTKEYMIDGRKEKFNIKGGVYSSNLEITGPGVILGPVLASENLRCEINSENSIQRYLSGLSAGKTIVTKPLIDNEIEKSPAFSAKGIKFIIRGDVNSTEKIFLENTFIIGSINAPYVEIKNCIVFGAIYATAPPGYFKATCSVFGIYNAKKVVIEGPSTIVVAGGISEVEPKLLDFKENEVKYPFSIRLLPLCRSKDIGCGIPNIAPEKIKKVNDKKVNEDYFPGICCPYWMKSICGYEDEITLSKVDFIKLAVATKDSEREYDDVERPIDSVSQKNKENKYFFGTQSRAANFLQMESDNNMFQRILHAVFAFEHLESKVRTEEIKEWKNLTVVERQLLSLATEGLESQI